MAYKQPTAGIADPDLIAAEASPETKAALAESTAVKPLTTEDVKPAAKKAPAAKKRR